MNAGAAPDALIVGGDGQIGRALRAAWDDRGLRYRFTSRRSSEPDALPLDLNRADAFGALPWPKLGGRVFLLAGVTSLRACRDDPLGTRAVNVEALGGLARRAADAGAVPVMVSTNLVFDGAVTRMPTDASPSPRTVYGQQKAELEAIVRVCNGLVVRPTKVLGPEPALLAGWRDALRAGRDVEAFTDLWFAPVPTRAVVAALLDAPPGVTQVSAKHDVSYFEAALHIAEHVGANPSRVLPRKAADADIPPEERPRYTSLACTTPFDPWAVLDEALGFEAS